MFRGEGEPRFEGTCRYCGKAGHAKNERKKRSKGVATPEGKPVGATPGQASGEP